MALIINNKVVSDANGIRLLQFTTGTRPGSPVQGQVIYNTDTNSLEVYDGGYWKQAYDGARPFLYRTVITTSYVCGGYQNSSPWTNGNRMTHSTDVCTNIGNILPLAGSYISGANSLTKGWFWGLAAGYPGDSTYIGGFNMATESSAGQAGTGMRNSRNDSGTVFKEHYFAYIGGGNTADMDVFNLTTEACYQNNIGPDCSGGDDGSGMSDENAGYLFTTSGSVKVLFATTVGFTTPSPSYGTTDTGIRGAHGQQKGINSKVSKGYAGNEGTYNGGYNLRRFNFVTDVQYGTSGKPVGNCGEENFDMGQDKQYMLGCYDGAQNNRGWKYTYSSESGYELGSGSVRTGVPGGSSGHCVWKG